MEPIIHDLASLGPVRAGYRSFLVGGATIHLGAGMIDKAGWSDDTVRHRSPWWSTLILLRGRGRYRDSKGVTADMAPGCVLHRLPDREHDLEVDPDSGWFEMFLVAGAPAWAALRALGLVGPDRPVQRTFPDRAWCQGVASFADQLRAADEGRLPGLGLAMGRHLADLLVDAGGHGGFRDRACQALAADLHKRLPLAAVARGLDLGVEAFRKRFRSVVGCSPQAYRIRRRIDRARDLLLGGANVTEAAEALGYPSPFALSTQFRSVMGVPPSHFRRR